MIRTTQVLLILVDILVFTSANIYLCVHSIFRAPDTASIKVKMMYSSSKDSLKKKLGEGLGIEIQANDHSDLDLNEIRQKQESKY